MALQIITVLTILMSLSVNGEFPGDFKLCKYGEVECLKTTINSMFANNFKDPDSINLPELNPLKFDNVRLQQGEESPVSLDLVLTNNNIYGLNTAKVLQIKGFGKDLTEKHSLHIHADYLSTVGEYEVNGKILILPITGNGKSNITMVDIDLYLNFVGTPTEKDGATFMQIDHMNVDAEPKNMIYNVENLFNGDKALGDNMNLFLNENWQTIFTEVRSSLGKAYGEIFTNVVNSVFSKYPYEKYFKE